MVVKNPRIITRGVQKRKSLAIGPQLSNMPSWNWVGEDTAKEMEKYYNVTRFKSLDNIPQSDYLMLVKHPIRKIPIEKIKLRQTKIIYCPIDFYHDPEQLHQDRNFLAGCNAIALHCERWMLHFKKYNSNLFFVEHHGKYTLNSINEYKKDGFVLWIGSFQYVPFLINYIGKNDIKYEIVICTDTNNERAKSGALKLSRELNISLNISKDKNFINEIKTYTWSEQTQKDLMLKCKAAIDVKSTTHFSQSHKPPTKAQKYISSGIPFAINKESYSYDYFDSRGLVLAEPHDTEKLFSESYWKEINNYAKELRKKITLENVGLNYKEIYEKS